MSFKTIISMTFAAISSLWPIQAAPPGSQAGLEPFQRIDLQQPEGFRRELTLRCLAQLHDPGFRKLLAARLGPEQTRVSLNQLVRDWAELWPTPGHRAFAARIQELDQDLRERLGIAGTSTAALSLRLVWPQTNPDDQGVPWDRVLFAVRPRSSASGPDYVEAYDRRGRMVRLDPRIPPAVPVILAGADRRETLRAGIETVNRGLRAAGFAPAAPATAPVPVECAKLTDIRLNQGQESWWQDGVEAYALVSGIDPAQDKPRVKLVDLPYLQHEATQYSPGQILLYWSDYRYRAANIQFFDHGDGTSYKDLLDAVLKAVGAAMAAAGAPVYAWIPALADAILRAMPSSWWRDSDTWLDTFYAVEQGQAYQERYGAGNAVRISLVPWTLQPRH